MDNGKHNTSFVENVAAAAATAEKTGVISKDQPETTTSGDCATEYQPRTFRPGSINSQRRAEILPAYPLTRNEANRRVLLLLSNVANVDREKCENDSFCGGHGVCPFEFQQHRYVEPIDSFMVDLYRDLFIEPSQIWKIHHSLIDYNLSQLRKCMDLYTKQTNEPALSSFNELTIALEFFLQIDVDVFFMKTCTFNGAHPRLFGDKNASESEGILCRAEPTARYGMMSCHQRNCFLCQSQGWGRTEEAAGRKNDELLKRVVGVQFTPTQLHRFINKYEAFLNCQANCLTSNIIYALTCPCGQWDYIGSTSFSFHDRILKHRDESNRVIREFLIGFNNMEHILKQQTRSAQTLANNEQLLYQHSPRCSGVLQHFLDNNPQYWCLVPMLGQEARNDDNAHASSASSEANALHKTAAAAMAASRLQPESPTFVVKPQFFEAVLRNSTRSREECIWLAKGVPKPPAGYRFSCRQIDEQMDFFKFKKEASTLSSHLVDCYNYTIIAVLPDDCSHELRRFIEALFITHAEPRLNTIGRLTHKGPWPSSTTPYDHSNRGAWCEKLVRNRSSRT